MGQFDRDFEADVNLDKFNLDGEADKQASIYLFWSKQAARALKAAGRAELDLKIRRAELAVAFRANPPGGVKVTNDSVTDYLDSHPEVRRLASDLIDAEADAKELEHGLRALQQKKDMIEVEVRLHLNNYFSTPGKDNPRTGGDAYRQGLGRRGSGE